uniref:Uncharacterized protein n=1 Tax=Globodera rostochiensis TaxID=31243 RepID=A0A914GXN5_GLORO
MGSKYYRHKGILDIIANRCLASGANAITKQDKTTFELSTAGSIGYVDQTVIEFLKLLLNSSGTTVAIYAAGKLNLTGERLTFRQLKGGKWLLVRCPVGREEDKWANWEAEAIQWEWHRQWNRISIKFNDRDIGCG